MKFPQGFILSGGMAFPFILIEVRQVFTINKGMRNNHVDPWDAFVFDDKFKEVTPRLFKTPMNEKLYPSSESGTFGENCRQSNL